MLLGHSQFIDPFMQVNKHFRQNHRCIPLFFPLNDFPRQKIPYLYLLYHCLFRPVHTISLDDDAIPQFSYRLMLVLPEHFLQSFLRVILREHAPQIFHLSLHMQVVPEGVTYRRSEMRPRMDNPCNRKRGKILPKRLKPAAHLLRQQLHPIFSRQSFLLAPRGNTLEVVNVVHIIYIPSHPKSMDFRIKGLQLGVGRVHVQASLTQGKTHCQSCRLPQQLPQNQNQLLKRRPLVLSPEAAVEHGLQFLGHGDTVQLPGSNEVDEFPLLVRCGEGAEEEHDDHGQAEDISPVIVSLTRGLFGGTEQLGPHRFAELLLFLPRLALCALLFDRAFPIFGLTGEAEIYEPTPAALSKHHVVQFHVAMDDPLRMQVAQAASDVESHLVVLPPEERRVRLRRERKVAGVEEALQIHLAQLSRDVYSHMLVVGETPRVALGHAPRLPTFLGWGRRRPLRHRTKHDSVGSHGVIAKHHFKLALLLLLRHSLCPLLCRKRLELDPAAVVFEDLRVVQLGEDARLGQRLVQLLLRLVLVAARAQRDDLRGKDPPVDPAAHAPHLREAPAADRPQVLEVPPESLNGQRATSCCVIFQQSKPSIDNYYSPHASHPRTYRKLMLLPEVNNGLWPWMEKGRINIGV